MSHALLKLRLALMAGRQADALRHLTDVEREEGERRARLREEADVAKDALRKEKENRALLSFKVSKQQRGNEARRAVDDGWEEDADRRHRAGEPWKAIAPDYSLSPSRCRALVYKWRGRRPRQVP